jgi:hypothetical protein
VGLQRQDIHGIGRPPGRELGGGDSHPPVHLEAG